MAALREFFRFSFVGAANSLLSILVIYSLLILGMGDYVSNFFGYFLGLLSSYFLNRYWTFGRLKYETTGQPFRYFITFIISYGVNIIFLILARKFGLKENLMSHFFAMGGYTIAFFFLARNWVFQPQRMERDSLAKFLWAKYPEISLSFASLSVFYVLRNTDLTHDVVWQFWISRQIIGGAKLYSDIWEVNPPLWFWSAIPIQWFAVKISISPLQLYIATIIALALGSAILIGRLMNFADPSRKFVIMALAFWVMVLMPLYDFGQREQLAVICALPYAALIARRYLNCGTSAGTTLLVGLLASYGFALKHYFIVIPIILEFWLLAKQRREWRILRPEIIALTICAISYAISVFIFAPKFISEMVPIISIAYHGYEVPYAIQMRSPIPKFWIAILICFALYKKSNTPSVNPFAFSFLVTASGFLFAFLVQHKGWLYHTIPVTGSLIMALGVRMMDKGIGGLIRYRCGLFVITFILTFSIMLGTYKNLLPDGEATMAKAKIPVGESVLFVATDPMWFWPGGEKLGLKWPSHFYSYWMIPAIAEAEVRGQRHSEIESLGKQVLKKTSEDIRCSSPALILVERKRTNIVQPDSFDVLAFLNREPSIRKFMRQHYTKQRPTEGLHVFKRIGRIEPVQGALCRRIV